jgi:hydrogenase maturation protein HypF
LKKKSDDFNYISPDNDYLGIMLPYTPVHYLLLEKQIDTLVMTSGNISDTPIVYNNQEALRELEEIADGFLMNNRDIHTRCDDSLVRVFENKEYPIRRSRGYVPYPIKINKRLGQILACGAEQKATFAITKGNYIFPSQHIGDLKNIETLTHYEEQIKHFKNMFDIVPELLVCDLHPDYMSTQYAIDESNKSKLPLYFVQHHHAHMASCMADNNLTKKVLGIIWDGTGYGTDESIWGGEFLVGDFKGFERVGSIRPIKLPGGDRATKEIYRIGYSQIIDSLGFIPEDLKLTENSSEILEMINSNFNCPKVSSMGRLFDGIGAILGLKSTVSYEGQCAIILENTATETEEVYSYTLYEDNGMIIFDWRPLVREVVVERMDKGMASGKFMNTLIAMALDISLITRERTGISDVVLSGGVFQNMYLLKKIKQRLESKGFNVYHHSRVSTNDEGIALGQVMIAAYGGGVNVSGNTIKNSRN